MLRDELSFREASNGSVRNSLVGYVANQLTVVPFISTRMSLTVKSPLNTLSIQSRWEEITNQ